MHVDWLGTARLTSSPTQTVSSLINAAPYGEAYEGQGTSAIGLFAGGMEQNLESDLFDTVFREYHPTQGRWISPDPAGVAAVDPSNPQTWNRYAYVTNNPLSNVDPTGLYDEPCDPWLCGRPEPGPEPGLCNVFSDPFCTPPGPSWPPGGGGGGGGGGAPGGGGKSNGGGTHGPWPGNETTGLPQLPTQPLSLGDLLGMTPGCDFGVCNPIGNGFAPGIVVAGAGASEGICILVEPCGLAELIGLGIGTVAVVYGPEIVQGAKNIGDFTSQFSKCLHEFIQDVKACNDAYPPGPARDECNKKAKQKFDLCKAGGTIQ